MTYYDACARAAAYTKRNECTAFVLTTLIQHYALPPTIDPDGYRVSDWFDGSVCATYTNGERE